MKKKYWIDESEGHPVIMTTDGKMPWKEAIIESWWSCRDAGPNKTMRLILALTSIGIILTFVLHEII